MFKKGKNKGFTLIELLVVIAIIGILSSVVLASLNTAREKSRDAKRISDVKQLQLALELYFDSNNAYPTTLGALTAGNFIPVLPVPPVGTDEDAYNYAAFGTSCINYHLGVTLENTTHTVLASDSDAPAEGTVCTGSGADFAGTDSPDTGMYDVRP